MVSTLREAGQDALAHAGGGLIVTQPQAVWNKFSSRERLSAIGAGLIILAWLIGLFTFGAGAGTIALLGAIAVLAVLFVKHNPTMNVTWPAAPSLIILGISAVVALLELIDLLRILPLLSIAAYFGGGVILSILLAVVGAALMVWGAWQEYQVEKPAMPNWASGAGASGTTTPQSQAPSATSSASAPPAAPPVAPPAAPASYDEHDEAPPA